MRGRFDDVLLDNVQMRGTMIIATHSSHSIGFYGATPISQRFTTSTAVSAQGAVSAGAFGVTTYGFATSTQFDALIARVNQVVATLVAYGLERGT